MFGNGDDIGAGDFSDGDTAVSLVGGVQVDVVGANASSNGNFEIFGFRQTFCGQVARVETANKQVLLVHTLLEVNSAVLQM